MSVYVPNGRASAPTSTPTSCAGSRRSRAGCWRSWRAHPRLAVMGDFNIAPRRATSTILRLGGPGAVQRAGARGAARGSSTSASSTRSGSSSSPSGSYTWWDYRMNAFRRKLGLRIDHVLLSPALARGVPLLHHRRRAAPARAALGPRAGGLRARLADERRCACPAGGARRAAARAPSTSARFPSRLDLVRRARPRAVRARVGVAFFDASCGGRSARFALPERRSLRRERALCRRCVAHRWRAPPAGRRPSRARASSASCRSLLGARAWCSAR